MPGRRLLGLVAMGCGFVLVAGILLSWAGLRINPSRSIPPGVYWIRHGPARRGAYVAVCPPPSPLFDEARRRGYVGPGSCRGGYRPLLKVLAGMPGDVVSVAADGVRVNGRLWPDSAPFPVDAAGRVLPRLSGLREVLARDRVWLMSERSPTGFDGRYFGALSGSAIVGTALPLLTW